MLNITAVNSVNIQRPTKAARKIWRTRREAQAAAVAEIGPHAREGFEFESYKCDGRWQWRHTDPADKPVTCAELKAMGGKRGLLSLAMADNALEGSLASRVAGAMVDSLSPKKLTTDVPPGVAGYSSKESGTAPRFPKTFCSQCGGEFGPGDSGFSHCQDHAHLGSGKKIRDHIFEERPESTATDAPMSLPEAEGRAYHIQSHHFAPESKMVCPIPEFLRRENTPETKARAAKIVHKAGERKIKNPPAAKTAKTAKAKAKKEGRGGGTKAALIGELLLRKTGCTTAEVLKATGWPSVSLPAIARSLELTLVKEKQGKTSRYWGKPKNENRAKTLSGNASKDVCRITKSMAKNTQA